MKRNISIKLKAAFLLFVFGLNTVVGFACAAGLDMGFNTHHHNEEATEVHVHADGRKHLHKKATHSYAQKQKPGKNNCCNDSVTKFSQTDKSVPPPGNTINPVFLTAFSASYCTINILYSSQQTTSVKYFVRGHHPPIPDIRIAIRSFQI
jgi:hypothetical protein